jgi:GlcNAc-P-P-Und epimerase
MPSGDLEPNDRYLVTGGSGFIGTNLIEELLKRGLAVLNVDIARPNIDAHGVVWKKQDILEGAGLRAAFAEFQPTHVIHLAARTDTDGTRLEEYEVNTKGTENVLDAIVAMPSIERVIITSTQFVNQYHGTPRDDLDFAPYTTYGESKVIAEQLTRAAGLRCVWTIVRPTNVWGPWHLRYPYEFWRVLGKGLYFHPGGHTVIRSYGYVKNVVWQILQMCEAPSAQVRSRVYYVGDAPINLLDWVNGFSVRQIGRKVWIVPSGLIRLLALVGDVMKARGFRFPITSSRYKSMTTSNDAPMEPTLAAFGKPPYSLDEGIEQTVAWLRVKHPELVTVGRSQT